MPRLFTGLEVPDKLRTWLKLKQGGLPGVRWIEPEDFHITLKFIGDVENRLANDLVEQLSLRPWQSPLIVLGELNCFGGDKPTAIFASVAHNDQLSALSAAHDRIMQQLGLPPDSRRFTPHITIGRCRGQSAGAIANYLAERATVMPDLSFRPSRFVLYSARDSRGGGPYRVEAAWPLQSNPD